MRVSHRHKEIALPVKDVDVYDETVKCSLAHSSLLPFSFFTKHKIIDNCFGKEQIECNINK